MAEAGARTLLASSGHAHCEASRFGLASPVTLIVLSCIDNPSDPIPDNKLPKFR